MAEHDFIDIGSRDAGVGQRFVGDADHEALDGLGIEFPERRVRPSDDAGCHGGVSYVSSSPRKRGPITLGFSCSRRWLPRHPNDRSEAIGPRFRGDDTYAATL